MNIRDIGIAFLCFALSLVPLLMVAEWALGYFRSWRNDSAQRRHWREDAIESQRRFDEAQLRDHCWRLCIDELHLAASRTPGENARVLDEIMAKRESAQ